MMMARQIPAANGEMRGGPQQRCVRSLRRPFVMSQALGALRLCLSSSGRSALLISHMCGCES